ncbi:papain-like cysteine protease family protein [Bradyrhizobium sp. CCGUVB1N3]|uniref:papain-like cysteine protease family protein n=1 Tax=Bradyrhizobium sp. CCGUVB1N3 TaxID=2949629 RepID=UPI003531F4C0
MEVAVVRLNVPLVGQQHDYDGQPIMRRDYQENMRPFGSRACWYASACMVSYYFRPGPRLGFPTLWRDDSGLPQNCFEYLALTEGLDWLVKPYGGFTPYFIAETLLRRGPIWAAVTLPVTLESGDRLVDKHVVVLTGVNGHTLYFNDPKPPARAEIGFFDLELDALFVKSCDSL